MLHNLNQTDNTTIFAVNGTNISEEGLQVPDEGVIDNVIPDGSGTEEETVLP